MTDPPTIVTRRAGIGDVDVLLENVRIAFDTYSEFAPAGWTPPRVADERERTVDLLHDRDSWALLAEVDGEPAGHVGLTSARERPAGGGLAADWRDRAPIPGMVHLWQLFVRPRWWGTGVAGVLHREFVAEAVRRGYRYGRLYTPAAHERARRFYERLGWRSLSEQLNPELGLAIAEYRLTFAAAR